MDSANSLFHKVGSPTVKKVTKAKSLEGGMFFSDHLFEKEDKKKSPTSSAKAKNVTTDPFNNLHTEKNNNITVLYPLDKIAPRMSNRTGDPGVAPAEWDDDQHFEDGQEGGNDIMSTNDNESGSINTPNTTYPRNPVMKSQPSHKQDVNQKITMS